MADIRTKIDVSLSDLKVADWKRRLTEIGQDCGETENLGFRHFALRIDAGPVLLVTFETVQGIRALSERAVPLGFDLVQSQGWSSISVNSSSRWCSVTDSPAICSDVQ